MSDRALFVVDDGEQHWYIHESAEKARLAHIEYLGWEPDSLLAKREPDEERIEVMFGSLIAAQDAAPDGAEVSVPVVGEPSASVTATAAEWATNGQSGDLIASTIY